jgi:hypothetical protein
MDSITLLTHLMKAATTKASPPSMMTARTIVLDQAKQANIVALSYIRMEREIGLLQYYGILGYFKKQHPYLSRFWSSSSSNSASLESPTTTTNPSTNTLQQQQKSSSSSSITTTTKARVAFMITSSQRKSLQQDLGYTELQIKQLTPTEASLILEHQLSPQESVDQLPSLLLLLEGAAASDAAAIMQSSSSVVSPPIENTTTTIAIANEETVVVVEDGGIVPGRGYDKWSPSNVGVHAVSHVSQDETASPSPLLQLTAASVQQPMTKEISPQPPRVVVVAGEEEGGGVVNASAKCHSKKDSNPQQQHHHHHRQWYELLEETDSGTMQVIGLFSKLDEAHLVLETKKDLAKKYDLPRIPNYIVRPTER